MPPASAFWNPASQSILVPDQVLLFHDRTVSGPENDRCCMKLSGMNKLQEAKSYFLKVFNTYYMMLKSEVMMEGPTGSQYGHRIFSLSSPVPLWHSEVRAIPVYRWSRNSPAMIAQL
jgi:hypothetical protein